MTLQDALYEYRYWIFGIAVVLVLAAFALIRSYWLLRQRTLLPAKKNTELGFQNLALDEHAIVSIADAKGNITYVNKRFCEISGYSREELLGKNHRLLKSEEHSKEFYKDIWRTIGNGKPWHGEIKNFKKDGGYYWVEASIVPFLNKQGKPIKYVGIRTDITARKKAENEKTEVASRKILRFQETLDLSKDIIHMFWPDTLKFFYGNKEALKFSGCSAEEFYILTPIDTNSNLDEDDFRKQLTHLIHGEQNWITYESIHTNSVGKSIPVEVFLQFVEPFGEKPRFVSFVRNISKRKVAEQEVNRLTKTLDFSEEDILMFWVDDLSILYANNAILERLGLDLETIIGQHPSVGNALFDEKMFREVSKPLILGTKKQVTYPVMRVNDCGEPNFKDVSLQMISANEERPYFVAIARDTTERVNAEKQMLRFKTTLDLTDDEVYMFWPDSLEFFYINQAAKRQLGWNEEEFYMMTPLDIKPEFEEEEFRNFLANSITEINQSVTFKTVHQRRNGELLPVEIRLQLMKPTNEPSRFVAIVRDITERQKVDKAKSEFISTVSHELRTPLTSIKGVLGLITAGAFDKSPEKLRPMAKIALENSERLNRLIDDLLDLEKYGAGNINVQMKATNLNRLVEEAIEANDRYGEEYGVKFRCTLHEDCLMVNADKERIMQVMANLLSNAAKFSPHGVMVDISVSRREDVGRVTVSNHGVGIPEFARATIFDRFTQADSSDQRAKSGTGLGLSIAKAIVEAHGGTIGFTSEVGKKTTFHFDLEDADANCEQPTFEFDR